MEMNFNMRMKGIEIINAVITAPEQESELSRFNFDLQFGSSFLPDQNQVTIASNVIVKGESIDQQLGRYTALFHFEVMELKDFVKEPDADQIEIPQILLTNLLGISVSTLRGMMFAHFKGTFLHNAILPLINVDAIQPTVEKAQNK